MPKQLYEMKKNSSGVVTFKPVQIQSGGAFTTRLGGRGKAMSSQGKAMGFGGTFKSTVKK